MTGLSGSGWKSSGRQRRIGSLLGRLSWTHRRYKWLVRAFPDVSAPPLMEAASRLQRSRYRRGEVIVAEGEPADRFYVITSGEAEVIQWSADRDVYIGTLQPGQFFGEVGLLTSGRRSATVRAVGNVKALTLDEGVFNQLVRRSESTAAGLAQLLQVRSVRVTPRGDAIPLPAWTRLMQRVFKHPRLRHYNRLIALVMAVNVAVLWYGLARGAWWSGKSPQLTSIALVAVTNFGLAIILRQQYVINFLCWLGTLPPTSWPLRLRWMFGKYYHFGGLHVGAAIAGTLWYAAFVGSLTYDLARGVDHVSVVNVAMSYAVVGCSSSSSSWRYRIGVALRTTSSK